MSPLPPPRRALLAPRAEVFGTMSISGVNYFTQLGPAKVPGAPRGTGKTAPSASFPVERISRSTIKKFSFERAGLVRRGRLSAAALGRRFLNDRRTTGGKDSMSMDGRETISASCTSIHKAQARFAPLPVSSLLRPDKWVTSHSGLRLQAPREREYLDSTSDIDPRLARTIRSPPRVRRSVVAACVLIRVYQRGSHVHSRCVQPLRPRNRARKLHCAHSIPLGA